MARIPIAEITVGSDRRDVDKAKVEELAESIAVLGLINPITLSQDKVLIAGRHRLEATRLLGQSWIEASVLPLENLHAELASIDENLIRNELTVLEQGELLVRRDAILKALGKRAEVGQGRPPKNGETVSPLTTTGDMARSIGLSERSAEQRMQAARDIEDDVRDAIRNTPAADSTRTLLQLARAKPDEQRALATKLVTGQATTIDVAKRLIARERNADLVTDTPTSPAGIYRTIVIDPPWDYSEVGDSGMGSNFRGMPSYAQMTVEEIGDLPVGDMADDNGAHLYLWTTNRMLPLSFALLERWGFRYITMLTWCKPQIGLGSYFRNTTEHVLFGVKGRLSLSNGNTPTHFTADRTAHSAKPDAFYELVENCSPGAYLELFARRPRPNWTVWGAEAG